MISRFFSLFHTCAMLTTSLITDVMLYGSSTSSIVSFSSSEKSRISDTKDIRFLPATVISYSCSFVVSSTFASSNSDPIPMIEFNGVRISCEIFAIKSSFACLASSSSRIVSLNSISCCMRFFNCLFSMISRIMIAKNCIKNSISRIGLS